MIVYTKECLSCNKHRQSIIFKQFCSNNQLSNSIQLLIQYTNLSYILSDPVLLYSSYIPIENIIVNTRKKTNYYLNELFRNYFLLEIIYTSSSMNPTNNTQTNGSLQMSNSKSNSNYENQRNDLICIEFLANNYTLIVNTSKTNYLATLDEVVTQNSANQNDGPVPLAGAVTMYSGLAQTVR